MLTTRHGDSHPPILIIQFLNVHVLHLWQVLQPPTLTQRWMSCALSRGPTQAPCLNDNKSKLANEPLGAEEFVRFVRIDFLFTYNCFLMTLLIDLLAFKLKFNEN